MFLSLSLSLFHSFSFLLSQSRVSSCALFSFAPFCLFPFEPCSLSSSGRDRLPPARRAIYYPTALPQTHRTVQPRFLSRKGQIGRLGDRRNKKRRKKMGAGRGGEREKGEARLRQARKVDRGRVHAAAKVPMSRFLYIIREKRRNTTEKFMRSLINRY